MRRDIIVVGASVGGVQALSRLVTPLPADLPAAIFVVLHTLPSRKSLLPEILGRATALNVKLAIDGEPIRPGCIYVAPSDQHLLVSRGSVTVIHGPKVNGHRPAVDALFRSAADACGARVIGVVLTGGRDCGTVGLQEIKKGGGLAIVQEPATALCPDMPASAVANVRVDHRLPLEEIAPALIRLVGEEVRGAMEEKPGANGENSEAPMTTDAQSMTPSDEKEWNDGQATDFSCPNCGGVMRQVPGERSPVRYRCRIGHAMSMESLEEEQVEALDLALSTALRALSENADLCRRVARRLSDSEIGQSYEQKAKQAEAQATLIREALLDRNGARVPGSQLVAWALSLPRAERRRLANEILDSLAVAPTADA